MTLAYIGVGSNLERQTHIRAAYQELSLLGLVRASNVYECQPVGFDSHAFYNCVMELDTELSLTQLHHQLRNIELKWGRQPNAQKLQDRTLDLDLLLFGEQVSADNPTLPRSDIFKFEFVLRPLWELSPQRLIASDGRTIEQIWQQFQGPKNSLTLVDFAF